VSEEYMMCPDCKTKRSLSEHADYLDTKSGARKWIQRNCPRGLKRCQTQLMKDGKKVGLCKIRVNLAKSR
jgi:hypothetical protein